MAAVKDWSQWTEADRVAASLEELAAHEPMGVALLRKALAADDMVSLLHAFAKGSVFLERLHGRTMALYLRDRLRLLSLFENPERILEIANVVHSSHPPSFVEGQRLFQQLMLELLTQYVLLEALENTDGSGGLVLDLTPLRELVHGDPSYGSGLAQRRLHELESIVLNRCSSDTKKGGNPQYVSSSTAADTAKSYYQQMVARHFPTKRIVSIGIEYTTALLEWLGDPPLTAILTELERTCQETQEFTKKRKQSIASDHELEMARKRTFDKGTSTMRIAQPEASPAVAPKESMKTSAVRGGPSTLQPAGMASPTRLVHPQKPTSDGSPSAVGQHQTPTGTAEFAEAERASSSPHGQDDRSAVSTELRTDLSLGAAPAAQSPKQLSKRVAAPLPTAKDQVAEALRYTESDEATADVKSIHLAIKKQISPDGKLSSAPADQQSDLGSHRPKKNRGHIDSNKSDASPLHEDEAAPKIAEAPALARATVSQALVKTESPAERSNSARQPTAAGTAQPIRSRVLYTPEEDEALRDGIRACGMGHWRLILNRIQDRLQEPHRTQQSLRKRAEQLGLQPEAHPPPAPLMSEFARVRFSAEEDAELRKGIERFGYGSWALILKHGHFQPRRTVHSLKARARALKNA
jgi:hypothetical protein